MNKTCNTCACNKVCDHNNYGFENCGNYVQAVHGEWCKQGNKKTCSVCAFVYYSNNDELNYCPNCGAKMDGKESE